MTWTIWHAPYFGGIAKVIFLSCCCCFWYLLTMSQAVSPLTLRAWKLGADAFVTKNDTTW